MTAKDFIVKNGLQAGGNSKITGALEVTTNLTVGGTLDANGDVDLAATADTATAATHYFVEIGTDGIVRPKTLANVKSEIVTTASVNSAAATTVGTVTSGTWSATTIATNKGGTGLTTFTAANNAIYSTSNSALTAGTLPTAAGGTGLTTFTAANNAIYSTSASALTAGTLPIAAGGTGQTTDTAAFNALSPLTTLGDTVYHNGTNNVRLAGNTTTTPKFLRSTGNGSAAAAPAWETSTGSGSVVLGTSPTITTPAVKNTYLATSATAIDLATLDFTGYEGYLIGLTSASNQTITINSPSVAVGTTLTFIKIGAGTMTFAAGTATLWAADSSLKFRTTYSVASITKTVESPETWAVYGDLIPA